MPAWNTILNYTVDNFQGINQAVEENKLAPGYTADCANMNTENGNLSVGYGFREHISQPVPGNGEIHRMYYWHTLKKDRFIVCAGNKIFAYNGEWKEVFDYSSLNTYDEFTVDSTEILDNERICTLTAPEGWEYADGCHIQFTSTSGAGNPPKYIKSVIINGTEYEFTVKKYYALGEVVRAKLTDGKIIDVAYEIDSSNWDFEEVRIGDTDHLIIANGQTQLVKYDGTTASKFGTGQYIYEGVVETVEHNATMATGATLSEADNVATFTLTMPSGWVYEEGCMVAFTMPYDLSASVNTIKIKISGAEYVLGWFPTWASGDTAIAKLATGTAAASTTVKTSGTTTSSTTIPDGTVTVTDATFMQKLNDDGTYEFKYDGTDWKYKGGKVTLGDYGIAITGTPEADSTITVVLATVPGSVSVTYATIVTKFNASRVYTFSYDGTDWRYNSLVVDLSNYGITVSGTPANGNVIKVKLNINSEPSDDEYGVSKINLQTALNDAQQTRCKAVGIYVNEESLAVKEILNGGTQLVLEETYLDEIEVGVEAKVLGGVSDIAVNYVEIYYSRLFSAGDKEHPSRLYWSQPPGDTRNIEDWSQDVNSDATSGGYTEIGNTSSDPIIGLVSLSNQLLIFKQSSIYRLLGDRPNNYRVVAVNKDIATTVNTSIIRSGDIPYWMTKDGLYYHDGQSARLSGNARMIHTLLESVSLGTTKSALNNDRLYFTCRKGNGKDDTMLVYDMKEHNYLLRNGFEVIDICAYDGTLYMINSDRYVYKWGREYDAYRGIVDGNITDIHIDAYWNTPFTDLGQKSLTKKFTSMFFRGEGGIVKIDSKVGKLTQHEAYQMPDDNGEVIRIVLQNEGRAFGFKIYNEEGSSFTMYGGLEVVYEQKEDR